MHNHRHTSYMRGKTIFKIETSRTFILFNLQDDTAKELLEEEAVTQKVRS